MTVHRSFTVTCSKGHITRGDKCIARCSECGEKSCFDWKIKTALKSDLTDAQKRARLFAWLERHDLGNYAGLYYDAGEMALYDADNTDQMILIADWNSTPPGLDIYVEALNIVPGYTDEYHRCSSCNKFVGTSPTSHGWQMNGIYTECELICRECAETDPDSIIDVFINNTWEAVPNWFYPLLEGAGFVCYSLDEYCERFETGMHPGQNDDPAKVAIDIETNLPNHDFIFKIDSVGQFDCQWSVYLRLKS